VSQNPKHSPTMVIHTLVVVGDQLLQAAIERQLQQVGHASASAGSVREAIERLRKEPFDVVMCELHPDGSEGTELMQYMGSYYPSTPVVAICEALSPEFRGQYEGGGSVRIVEKPIDLRKLVEIIESCGPHKGFFGNQVEIEFFDYVQMVAVSARDKALIVNTRAGTGYIWFEHGDIVHAQFHDYRGEQAFYKLLSAGRGTYREVFFRPPPARTIVRPSMHLLMEAARQADEGILGDSETIEAEEEKKKPKKRPEPEPEPEPDESLSMMDEDLSEPEPPPRAAPPPEPVRARAPMPKPERPSTPAKPPPASVAQPVSPPASASTAAGRRSDSERPAGLDMAGVADSAIARFDELTMPSDDDEVEANRARGGTELGGDGVPTLRRRVQTLERPIGRPTPVSMPAVGGGRPTPAPIPVRGVTGSLPSRATPASTPVARPTGTNARPVRTDAKPIKKATSVDLLDDPETRELMLGQFWQFEGVNGVAIISSTGKVIAEEMRNNTTVVTLAGFYMRGAARIARTLGYNVFDGVIARAASGQQMIMVGMGATSAVLSVAPGHDPEVIRDAIMGVESKR
jgi:CheY-like chemotaxis protein/predicted regulator of Ras-like GTPase activity (Roadblock/LC7/MglB family)